MGKYRLNFTKVVYGFYETEADSKKEAIEKIANDDCDVFDNKSDETPETDNKGEWKVYLDE